MDHAGSVAPPVLARRAKDLPEEVLRYVMAYSIAVDLARMERVAHTTRRAAQKAAHQRLTAAPWFRNDENEPPIKLRLPALEDRRSAVTPSCGDTSRTKAVRLAREAEPTPIFYVQILIMQVFSRSTMFTHVCSARNSEF